ncbi:MAG: SET domain-containing protein [Spirochaetes bacterium]|nr:MAG: SET domain-containing protein [Spirochaetota bacterium]
MVEETGSDKGYLIIRRTEKGKSVFARKQFAQGEYIVAFRGKRYTREEYKEKLNPRNNHFLQVGQDVFLGPTRTADNYVNHSCDPNCGLRIENDRVNLYSIREIREGEEITFDYSTSMDEDYWEMDCNCGSALCRRRVRDFKYLPADVRDRYVRLGIVPDFIRASCAGKA